MLGPRRLANWNLNSLKKRLAGLRLVKLAAICETTVSDYPQLVSRRSPSPFERPTNVAIDDDRLDNDVLFHSQIAFDDRQIEF
jgi:hypothetical protein